MKTLLVLGLFCVLAVLIWLASRKPHPQTASTAPAPSVPKKQRDAVALTKDLSKPSILITKTGQPTGSYFGGEPPAYAGFVWPEKNGVPLTFLACFDCKELPRVPKLDWLPAEGYLLFFYDVENQPWGFDPSDRGGWKTLYVAPEAAFSGTVAPPPKNATQAALPKKYVAFRTVVLPPTWEEKVLQPLGLTQEEDEALADYRHSLFNNQPHHQIGGYSDPVQGVDMDEECQLASNGIYLGNAEGYQDPRVEKLKADAAEWSLLFQMDTDDEMNLMWGDAGMIYFWVKRSEAREKHFENTWLILQCG